jgi:prepilin-type N-terminal cleavage/methylation domain-containing protein
MLILPYISRRTTSSRGGFTLVELLVVIGIIAILAGVALGPITNGIKQAKHNAAMQTGRQIGQVTFSYSTDNTANGNLYPADTSALAISQDLINANYVTDPSIFAVTSQPLYQAPTSSGTAITLKAQSVSWSYTCISLNTTGGISSSASDLTPLVFFNNGFSTAVSNTLQGGTGTAVAVTYGAAAPFGTDGAAVFYKGNNALYLKAGLAGTVGQIASFISANDIDSTKYNVAP